MTAVQARPPGGLRALRPHRDDVLIALGGALGGLVLWWFRLSSNPVLLHGPRWLVLLPQAAMCLAVLGRRTLQPYALLLALVAQITDVLLGSLLSTLILFTDVLYAAVLYGSQRLARVCLSGSVVFTAVFSVTLLAAFRKPELLLISAACAGVMIVPTSSGMMIRNHREAAAAERLRAEQTALLAEMDRKQAINAERARMARELHDVVANHLSAIAIHSTAALSLPGPAPPGDPTRDALGVIRENSVQGLAEMRRLIGLLRDSERRDEPATAPSLDGLDALLERARAAGGGHHFALEDRRAPAEPLPAPVQLAAYRVVQEAVTNALKHAAAGTVTVLLDRCRERRVLEVRITSPLPRPAPGTGDAAAPRAPGAGAGLIGMRERVELLGGELAAGPADGPDGARCWAVHAVLPLPDNAEAAARSPSGPGTDRPRAPGPDPSPGTNAPGTDGSGTAVPAGDGHTPDAHEPPSGRHDAPGAHEAPAGPGTDGPSSTESPSGAESPGGTHGRNGARHEDVNGTHGKCGAAGPVGAARPAVDPHRPSRRGSRTRDHPR
ncbi:sensor histidine kinase [Streptomyces cacaoi]|uniref:sensor histidine kinase n=1 Tax=Streptomyces cacaoi TaxID=1898 RepID=UPI0033236634